MASPGAVLDCLFLDAATQLGLGDAPHGGLPGRRRADAAGGGDRTPRRQTDPRLHLVDRARDAIAHARHGVALRCGRAVGRGVAAHNGPPALRPSASRRAGRPAAAVPALQLLPGRAALRCDAGFGAGYYCARSLTTLATSMRLIR